jgi:hypothetical protein
MAFSAGTFLDAAPRDEAMRRWGVSDFGAHGSGCHHFPANIETLQAPPQFVGDRDGFGRGAR